MYSIEFMAHNSWCPSIYLSIHILPHFSTSWIPSIVTSFSMVLMLLFHEVINVQRQGLHLLFYIPSLSCKVLGIKLTLNMPLLVCFFPWIWFVLICFHVLRSTSFLCQASRSFWFQRWGKCSTCLAWAPRLTSPMGVSLHDFTGCFFRKVSTGYFFAMYNVGLHWCPVQQKKEKCRWVHWIQISGNQKIRVPAKA